VKYVTDGYTTDDSKEWNARRVRGMVVTVFWTDTNKAYCEFTTTQCRCDFVKRSENRYKSSIQKRPIFNKTDHIRWWFINSSLWCHRTNQSKHQSFMSCVYYYLLLHVSIMIIITINTHLPLFTVFTSLRKMARSDCRIRHVCLSVCRRGTRLPLQGFSRNLILDYFSKICRESQKPFKPDNNNGHFT